MAKRCPHCKADIPDGVKSPDAPFCSERCRLLDLGAWLDEEYRVPGAPVNPAAPPTNGREEEDDG